jgi:predicted protein tyrosine phosphatase
MRKTKLLFVCIGNRDRSPTAEDLFRNSKEYEARSAGTSAFGVRRVTKELIDWADQIFVMSELDDGHLTFLETHFNLKGKAVYDLDIPDGYGRGSQELINLLAARLGPIPLSLNVEPESQKSPPRQVKPMADSTRNEPVIRPAVSEAPAQTSWCVCASIG